MGASIDTLKKGQVYAEFLSSTAGKRLLTQYPTWKPVYNKTYRKKIEELVEADQYFRKKPSAYTVYGDTIKAIDRKNIADFLSLTKKYGFPSESKIGIDPDDFTNPLYSLIILHQSNGPLQQFDFYPLLSEQILKGNIENKAGLFMMNRVSGGYVFDVVRVQHIKVIDSTRSKSNPNNYTVLQTSKWGYYPLNEKEEKVINAKRKEFYLDSYEEGMTKTLYSLEQSLYLLSAYGSYSTLTYPKYADYQADKLNLKFR